MYKWDEIENEFSMKRDRTKHFLSEQERLDVREGHARTDEFGRLGVRDREIVHQACGVVEREAELGSEYHGHCGEEPCCGGGGEGDGVG